MYVLRFVVLGRCGWEREIVMALEDLIVLY